MENKQIKTKSNAWETSQNKVPENSNDFLHPQHPGFLLGDSPLWSPQCGPVPAAQPVDLRLGLRVSRGCPKNTSCCGFLLAFPPWSPFFFYFYFSIFLPIDIVVTPKHSVWENQGQQECSDTECNRDIWSSNYSILLFLCFCGLELKFH